MRSFRKEKISELAGQTAVLFTEESEVDDNGGQPFTIRCTKEGINFFGNSTPIEDIVELQAFAKIMDQAYRSHRELLPKLEVVKSL